MLLARTQIVTIFRSLAGHGLTFRRSQQLKYWLDPDNTGLRTLQGTTLIIIFLRIVLLIQIYFLLKLQLIQPFLEFQGRMQDITDWELQFMPNALFPQIL